MLAHWCVKGYGVAEILLFDLYGTLVDPLAIAADLTEVLGADGSEVSRQWRAKQLEFSFRLTVMGSYLGFRAVTAAALEFALASAGLTTWCAIEVGPCWPGGLAGRVISGGLSGRRRGRRWRGGFRRSIRGGRCSAAGFSIACARRWRARRGSAGRTGFCG